jgi:hypothetical protein
LRGITYVEWHILPRVPMPQVRFFHRYKEDKDVEGKEDDLLKIEGPFVERIWVESICDQVT